MNKLLKIILLGVLIWAIPFVVSFFVWDVEAGGPSVSNEWFNAIMAFSWAIGFAIAAFVFFKESLTPSKDGWTAGITWYIVLILMDYLVLVLAFGMSYAQYAAMLVTYLNTLLLTGVFGEILKRR